MARLVVAAGAASYLFYRWLTSGNVKDEEEYQIAARANGFNNKILDDYYFNYVDIRSGDMTAAKSVLNEIESHIKMKLRQNDVLDEFRFSSLVHTGSAFKDLKVIAPDEFDVMITLVPTTSGWVQEDGDLNDPAFSVIKNVNKSSWTWSGAVEYGKLIPATVRSKFQSFIQRAMNDFSKYKVTLSTPGPAITLSVFYGRRNEKFLSIDFVPAIELKHNLLVAKPHPERKDYPRDPNWRKSFSVEERKALGYMSWGCQKKCLKIMKAVRLNNPSQLGMLSSYVYKTILLHMADEGGNWDDAQLPERCISMLKKLLDILERKELPHYFIRDKNLLKDYPASTLKNTSGWIKRYFNKNNFKDLLKKEYQPVPPDAGKCTIS